MSRCMAMTALGVTSVLVGCAVTVNPGPRPSPLLAVTGRSILEGQPLALVIPTPEAGRRVTIVVQASTDRADPDFRVVRGEVDFGDLDSTPISDLVLISAERGSGQEIAFFTPDAVEPYTLFVEDRNSWPDARFSVTVTQ